MNDFELSHGLSLLADEAKPAAVDVYDVIAKARSHTRNRRAVAATALATVTVAGTMIGVISLGAGQPPTTVGSPPSSSAPIIGWSPPAGATMVADAFNDNQMNAFTDQLAEAWPSIKPRGVTTGKLDWFAEGTSAALKFRGYRTTDPPDSITYATAAELSDSLGTNELSIYIIKVGPHDWPFQSVPELPLKSSHDLPDGTHVEIRSSGGQRVTQVLRPDDTAMQIVENSSAFVADNSHGRPGFILDTEALLKLAKALSYS